MKTHESLCCTPGAHTCNVQQLHRHSLKRCILEKNLRPGQIWRAGQECRKKVYHDECMCVCLCVYVSLWVCVSVSLCASMCVCLFHCVSVSATLCVCVSLCMYVCISVGLCMHVSLCVSLCVCLCRRVYMCLCLCLWVCVYMCVCVSLRMSLCLCRVCMYICIFLCVSVCGCVCISASVCICASLCVSLGVCVRRHGAILSETCRVSALRGRADRVVCEGAVPPLVSPRFILKLLFSDCRLFQGKCCKSELCREREEEGGVCAEGRRYSSASEGTPRHREGGPAGLFHLLSGSHSVMQPRHGETGWRDPPAPLAIHGHSDFQDPSEENAPQLEY